MEEIILFGALCGFLIGVCAGCDIGKSENETVNRQKMIELNLAHYNQNTGEYVQDSISCKNDSCVIIRKNGE